MIPPMADPPFSFRSVQVFVATVEASSVTRAAERLRMSPSSVSQQLSNLETALGAKLIERTARTFRLTPAGELFRPRALRLLDDVGAAKAELALARQEPRMSLRIASIEDFDAGVTPHWLGTLSREFPNIGFSVTSGLSHENHDALADRAVDAMLAADASRPPDWVERHEILRDVFILVTAADLGPVRTLADFASRPFLRYAPELYIGRQIEAHLKRAGITPEHGFEFTTNRALFAMTAECGGWTISTALSLLGSPTAADAVRAHPLPLPGFSRRIALNARRGALGKLPAIFAERLRRSIESRLMPRVKDELPFAANGLRIIEAAASPNRSFDEDGSA